MQKVETPTTYIYELRLTEGTLTKSLLNAWVIRADKAIWDHIMGLLRRMILTTYLLFKGRDVFLQLACTVGRGPEQKSEKIITAVCLFLYTYK